MASIITPLAEDDSKHDEEIKVAFDAALYALAELVVEHVLAHSEKPEKPVITREKG